MSNLYTQYTYFIMRKDYAEKNGIKSVGDIIRKTHPFAAAETGQDISALPRSNFIRFDRYAPKQQF